MIIFSGLICALLGNGYSQQGTLAKPELCVKQTVEFKIDGTGTATEWNQTDWVMLPKQEGEADFVTKMKTLYSESGIYFLFQCEDQRLTATIEEDFGSLFKEDVVEVFLRPDTALPIYLEYELSPLNYELPLLIVNTNGAFNGWRPNSYAGDRKVVHATSVQDGKRVSGASISGWTGEIFVPFRLLQPLVREKPEPGAIWKANFYRIDYDKGYTSWTWAPTTPQVRGSFHEMEKFGALIFE